MTNLTVTDDSALTTMTSLDRTNDRMLIVDSGAIELKDIAPKTLMPDLPSGVADNYSLSVSVASNNITLALKDVNGADPSPGSPVKVKIGTRVVFITAALSVTVNAAANSFNAGSAELATKLINYFVYIGYKVSDASVFIGFARIPFGRVYSEFSGTATNEKYLAASTSPAITDNVVNVGRFSATLSAGAGYTWSVSGTGDVINNPIYETDWLAWQPAYSANGSMTYTTVTTNVARYRISWQEIKIFVYATGTTGGVAATALNATLPFDAAQIAAFPTGYGFITDGTSILGRMTLNNGTPDIAQAIRYDGANFGLGASRSMSITAFYEI